MKQPSWLSSRMQSWKRSSETPPDMIDLVISDQVDMTNGFAVPMADCITIYTPNLRWSDVGNTKNPSWLEALLFHELVHEIELNQVRGGARLARLLFGK